MIGLPGTLRTFLVIVLLGLLPGAIAYGQPRYIIKHYTNENGLPANGVQGIELDKKTGFLWVGTQAGLVRFDGKQFLRFGSAKNTAIPSRIVFIGKNREGTIYCEEDNFSVYRIAGNEAEWVTTDSFLIARFMQKGGSNPVRPFEEMTEKLRNATSSAFLPPWIVFHEQPGDGGSFSFLYFDRIYYYNGAEDRLLDFPGFQHLLKVGDKVYYVRPNLEVWTYDRELKKTAPVPVAGMPAWNKNGKERPRYIWAPGMEAPLLIYQKDIWQLQGKGDSLHAKPLCRSCCPPNAYITSAQVWKEQGVIFLGSYINGLYVVRAPYLQPVRSDTTAIAAVEYAQAEIVPGVVNTGMGLVYSAQGQLLPGQSRIVYPNKNIYQDRQGDFWFYSGDTIIRYDPKENHTSKLALHDGSSKMVFAETRNRLFVILDKGIGEITDGQYRSLYQLRYRPNSLSNALSSSAALEWQPGVLAIAAEKLLLFDTEKRAAPDTVLIPGLKVPVRSLLKHGDYLFIGTYGQGFYVYKNGVVKKMPLDKNQYLAYTHCFVPDEKGYCWISTNHGLFKASLQALTAAYENNLTEIYYHYFGKEDGIVNTEFNGGCQPCALTLSSGLFSFPSMNGVVVFDPQRQHTPPPRGQLFIDEVLADSHTFQPGDSALQTLSYYMRNLRLKVSLPQFGNSENINFSYQLTPYDEEWESQDILQNNIIQFGGLKPGSYTLVMRVRNGYGPDEFGTTTFSFRILPPWYWSWWFYALCGLGIIALMWGLVKWRTARINQRKKELQQLVMQQTEDIAMQSRQLENHLQQLQQQQVMLEEDNKVKTRLIGIISHDLMSPIKFMGYLGRKLRDSFSGAEPAHKTADSFVRVTQELESLTVNMLNWIKFHHTSLPVKPERFNVHELVSESVEIAATLAREKGLLFYNEVPTDTEFFQYRQAIGVIIYNLAMNAVKYTPAGEIRISCQCSVESLSLAVSDTGPGMSDELVVRLNSADEFVPLSPTGNSKRNQFGYVIIKDLLRLVNGSLHVQSIPGKGSRITVGCFLAD